MLRLCAALLSEPQLFKNHQLVFQHYIVFGPQLSLKFCTKHQDPLWKYFQKVAGKIKRRPLSWRTAWWMSGISILDSQGHGTQSEWTNGTDGWHSATPTETGAGLTNAEAAGGGRRKGGGGAGGGGISPFWAGPPAESPAAGLFGDSLFPRTSETRCEAIFCKDCRTSWMFRLGASVHFIYSLYLLRLLHQSRAICMVKTLWETFPKESVCSPSGKEEVLFLSQQRDLCGMVFFFNPWKLCTLSGIQVACREPEVVVWFAVSRVS